ncbi:MAG TPA: D-aminoacyl-tRNA deacylase [Actinomycetota bacterium]|nr:D-aminoacyl-tRNA deacylase [Actinomycetota bacterium]
MRAVVQRCSRASVRVGDEIVGEIGRGLVVLVGVGVKDSDADAAWLVEKLRGLRIFPDDEQNMNRSVSDAGGALLVISQFTLHGDARKGRRPSFIDAARPEQAEPLVVAVAEGLRAAGLTVAEGRFGAMMDVELVNDGPVTILLDSERRF